MGTNSSAYLKELLWGFNEITDTKGLARSPAQ